MACRNRVDDVSRNGQRVATVSKKFDFSDTPRGVSDAVSGRVGTYRRVGERPTLRHSMVRGVRASYRLFRSCSPVRFLFNNMQGLSFMII